MTKPTSFSTGRFIPLYRQFMDYVKEQIRNGEFARGTALPSIHAMVIRTGISRETIVKGYADLCHEGVLVSRKGKGYFVRDSFITGTESIMVFMDKMSQHQQDIMDGFIATVGTKADITIRMHYQNPQWFAQALDNSLDRYDWYILFPHFPQDPETQRTINSLIRKIPSKKLLLMDHLPAGSPKDSGACYQSIENDVPTALESVIDDIRSFSRLRYISLSVSLYGDLVAETIREFGKKNSVSVDILKEIPKTIEKGDLFFVSGSRLDRKLSELLKLIYSSSLIPGKDVGLICYNDFPLNEFIFGGLTTLSVNFMEIGKIAGNMVLSGKLSKVRCPASLIRRNTF